MKNEKISQKTLYRVNSLSQHIVEIESALHTVKNVKDRDWLKLHLPYFDLETRRGLLKVISEYLSARQKKLQEEYDSYVYTEDGFNG